MTDVYTPTTVSISNGEFASAQPLNDLTVLFETPRGPVYFFYIEDDGLGMPPQTALSERGPIQHGDTDLGARYDPRMIRYIFGVHAPSSETDAYLRQAKSMLLRIFRRTNQPAQIRYNISGVGVRTIEGYISSGLTFGSVDREAGTWFQRFGFEFKANDPFFYDPTPVVTTITNDDWDDDAEFVVPLPIPFGVGISTFNSTQVVVNAGDIDTYPTIRINGPMTDPVITHDELGWTIPLDGSLSAGEYWDVLLEPARKDILDQNGVSVMGILDDPNNIDLFRLVAAPDISDGENTIIVTGRNANEVTSVVFTYYTRYLGI